MEHGPHWGIRLLVGDLNRIYREQSALFDFEFESQGFEWIDCHDSSQSVLIFMRRGRHGETVIVALNFTPVPREGYRIGLPGSGYYRELLNSDSEHYGGSNVGNAGGVEAEHREWMNRPWSASLNLPPLGAVVLLREER